MESPRPCNQHACLRFSEGGLGSRTMCRGHHPVIAKPRLIMAKMDGCRCFLLKHWELRRDRLVED